MSRELMSPSPLTFPDPMRLAAERGRAFQRLASTERWTEILAMMALGLNMAKASPRREIIEQRWLDQEREWQDIQRRLFAQYGQ